MESFWQQQTAVNLFIQSLGGWLDGAMRLFTFLGNEQFFMLVMPAFYWCLDTALGLRMGIILLASDMLNGFLKISFHTPRPYWVNPQVQAHAIEPSFGMPSGHSQNSASLWGRLAASSPRRWVRGILLGVVGLVGISRLYMGVHFLTDVLSGWLIGFILLFIFLRLEKPAAKWLAGKSAGFKKGCAFVVSAGLIALFLLLLSAARNWPIPALWMENARLAGAPEGASPLDPSGFISNAGTLCGILAGAAWLQSSGGYSAAGSGWRIIARYGLGLVGVVAIWYGLDKIFPDGVSALALFLRWLRYALVGVWVCALAPKVFITLGWASASQEAVAVQPEMAA